jgi:hypothetical protein
MSRGRSREKILMAISFLVCPDGRLWLPGSPDLRRHIAQTHHHLQSRPDAFDDLGYASFRFNERHVRLVMRRETLSRACVRQLTELFIEYEPNRIVIEQTAPTLVEIFSNVNDAVAWLDELRRRNVGEVQRPPFNFEMLGLERLRHPKRLALLRSYNRWKRAKGQMSMRELADTLANPYPERTLVTRFVDPDRPVVEAWPRRLKLSKPCEILNIIGRALQDHPDPAYGEATAAGYIAVNRTQRPRLELVESAQALPGGGTRWARYERLLLPWRAGEHERLVISESLTRAIRVHGGAD